MFFINILNVDVNMIKYKDVVVLVKRYLCKNYVLELGIE